MKRNSLILLTVYLGSIFAAESTAQQPLRWKLAEGQNFSIKLIQLTDIVSTVEKRTKNISNSMTLNMNWDVDSINKDEQFTILQTITSIQLELNDPARGIEGEVKIDTLAEENSNLLKKKNLRSELLQQVMPLVGLELQMVMSPRGEIIDVIVPPATLEALRQLPGSMRLRQLFTHRGLKDIWGQSAFTLPENEIAVDDSWESKSEIMLPMGKFERANTYQVTSLDDQQSSIELTTTIDVLEPAEIKEGQTQVKLIEFNGSGTIQWDVTRGILSSSKVENTIKTDRPYREKNVITTATSKVELTITPKPATAEKND